jgi:uncharacterized protein YdeI (BOF family)
MKKLLVILILIAVVIVLLVVLGSAEKVAGPETTSTEEVGFQGPPPGEPKGVNPVGNPPRVGGPSVSQPGN